MCDLQVEAYQGCCNLLIEAYKGVVIWKLANVLRLKVLPSQRTEQQHSLLRLGLGLGLEFHSQPLKKQKKSTTRGLQESNPWSYDSWAPILSAVRQKVKI